ncbi:unnamed protein product [Rhodiola kirilowii]
MDALAELNIARPLTPRYEVNEIRLFKSNIFLPSIVQAPKVELKPLPAHLKYEFLGENDTLPVIIKDELEADQEHRLIEILARHKQALGWTLADIQGISPAVCMHRILLEDEAKPSREPQRRLNPIMMEVVQKEIQKLLDADVIYPISDSQWVSLVHVVPKKTGITVERNAAGEMVTTRVKNGWRMCIDYRKLNAVTRKDHFPLPFINQMLDRLAGKPYFCFLDGFSGYNQIPIAPEDQEKMNFTCPFGHVVSHEGIKVDKAKIDLILTLPYPSTVRDIKSFLAHAGFYRRFIKDFSKKALPLSNLLQKEVPFEFTDPCRAAFDELK